jgi:hypothetical protein
MFTREEALERVEGTTVTELFGPWTANEKSRKEARRLYWGLAAVLHPDRVGEGDTRAGSASKELTRLYREWTQRTGVVELRTPSGRAYRMGALHGVGSIANVYLAEDGGTPYVVKMVRNPALNGLLYAEWDAMRALDGLVGLEPYYPRLVDRSGPVERGERASSVFEPLVDGFVTLAEVRRAFPSGLDGRDYAWMHRRLLRAIEGAHRAGLVHGAIVPENVLVHPGQHGIVLAGWSFCVEEGQRPLATSETMSYPPEVGRGAAVTAATDVHMAHALMLDLLGDNEIRQRTFARGCMQENPGRRPDAVDLLGEYDELLDELYGRRVFRPFAVPRHKTGA